MNSKGNVMYMFNSVGVNLLIKGYEMKSTNKVD